MIGQSKAMKSLRITQTFFLLVSENSQLFNIYNPMGNGDSTCWDLYSRNWSSKENCDDNIIANDFSVKYSDIMCVYACVCVCTSVYVWECVCGEGYWEPRKGEGGEEDNYWLLCTHWWVKSSPRPNVIQQLQYYGLPHTCTHTHTHTHTYTQPLKYLFRLKQQEEGIAEIKAPGSTSLQKVNSNCLPLVSTLNTIIFTSSPPPLSSITSSLTGQIEEVIKKIFRDNTMSHDTP